MPRISLDVAKADLADQALEARAVGRARTVSNRSDPWE